ncbi:MAG: hypothetical protein AAFQ22_00485 [Pseudomonadota bacterium]
MQTPFALSPRRLYFLIFQTPPANYEKPEPPYCLLEFRFSGQHDCSRWEIDDYEAELFDFERRLREYLIEVDDYLRQVRNLAIDAEDYVDCQINNMLADLQ